MPLSLTIADLVTATRKPETAHITDEQILAAIGDRGMRTEAIADRLGALRARPAIYRRLLKLEAGGKVRRQERYSSVNSIRWERTDG